MKLIPMSEPEYNFWAPRSRAAYAADKMRANSVSKEEAERIADADFQRFLPDGLNTRDSFLFTAKDESDNVLGFIWFCIRGPENDRQAFICDVIIEEPYRGQGYGRKIMTLVEQEIRKLSLNRVGLHVFGFNETAISLYRSLGYRVVDLVMDKTLSQ